MVLFDTNMILRCLMDGDQEMAVKAEECIDAENVAVTVGVIAEVVCVLKGVYAIKLMANG